MAAGVEPPGSLGMEEISLLSKGVFFLGLHETTLHWCRVVVKPVVDDTIFGVACIIKSAKLAIFWYRWDTDPIS
jgi:hypothetical protein